MITQSQFEQHRTRIRTIIDQRCILRPDGLMLGKASGQVYSGWIFMMLGGLLDPELLEPVSECFLYEALKKFPDGDFQIMGHEADATPMLSAIPIIARRWGFDINSIMVRRERKKYGPMNTYEGRDDGRPKVFIGSLCNSSDALLRNYQIATANRMTLTNWGWVLVNKSNRGVHSDLRCRTDMYIPSDIEISSLFLLDDFGLDRPSH